MDDLASYYDQVVEQTRRLQTLLQQEHPKLWMMDSEQPLQALLRSLRDFWYRDGQDGRETTPYYGLIAGSESLLEQVQRLNDRKAQFKKAVSDFRNQHPSELAEQKQRLAERHPALADELNTEGLARLHLKQVSRQLPLLDQPPAKIGFNWYSSGRSIQRITKKLALEKLEKLGVEQPHIRIQYDALAQHPDHQALALVQQLAPIMRANILFGNGNRKAMNVAMPIFFPDIGGLPAFNIPPETPPEKRSRQVRSDQAIEEEAFLPSIRVHRYLSAP